MKLMKLLTLLSILTLFAGCNIQGPESLPELSNSTGGEKISQVQVTIGGNARTILPNVSFSKYKLSAESAEIGYTGYVPEAVETDGNWGRIGLPYGEWIITVTAYIRVGGVDYLAAKGSAPLYVYDTYHDLEVAVNTPELGGTGTFAYTVRYPADGSASLELKPLGGGAAVVTVASVANGSTVNVSNVNSGVYFLTVSATNGRTVIRNEIVHIYQQSTTEADYAFTKLDFNDGFQFLNIGGTIKVLVNGEQMADMVRGLYIDYADISYNIPINFTGTNGDATWECQFTNLRGANTISFRVDTFLETINILTIPVPLDDATNIDLGTVNVEFEITPLAADTWTNGSVFNNYKLYSINVVQGQTYHLWWNNAWSGNGSKTATFTVEARYDDLSYISIDDFSAWYDPTSFVAGRTGIVYIVMYVYDTGTYAIGYSTNSRWHYNSFNPVNAVSLPANNWHNGNITTRYTADWYTTTVSAGTTYYLWWDDSYSGERNGTLDIDVYVYTDDGNIIFQGDDIGFDPTSIYTGDYNGTVYLRVRNLGGGDSTGTYAIGYSTSYDWR